MKVKRYDSIGRMRPTGRILPLLLGTVMPATMLLTGCKPTESNYQAAYEAARAKRETVDVDAGVLSGGHKIISTDGPKTRTVDGREVRYRVMVIKPEGVVDITRTPYRVAVGQWSMPTNARSQAADLKQEGMNSFIAKDSKDRWWTIIGAYDTFDEAARAAIGFADTHPDFSYIGLDGAPLVICR